MRAAPLNDVDDVLFLTHLASATDVDWFRIPVAQGEQLSVYLANLPADYDVLLYGPAKAPLRGTPSRVLPPSPDGGLSLIGAENATNALVGADIVTTPPNDDWELYAVSSRRGTDQRAHRHRRSARRGLRRQGRRLQRSDQRVAVQPARPDEAGRRRRRLRGHPGGRADAR